MPQSINWHKWLLVGAGCVIGFVVGRQAEAFKLQGSTPTVVQQPINLSLEKQLLECKSKFNRSTILYDGNLIQGPHWIIPADVEPVYVGPSTPLAAYSHYDQKTQVETVKLQPQRSQK